MNIKIKVLNDEAWGEAEKRYEELYLKALPGSGGIEKSKLEIATFNCSETIGEFEQVGLGLETVVIFRDESGAGHTGKVLLNLPGQLLLEHGHVNTYVLGKGAVLAKGFVKLSERVNGFGGIVRYINAASKYINVLN